MRVLAVINQKGGVAKSTTALAIGALLTGEGKRVLYIDLDAQANMSYALGVDGAKAGAYEVLTRSASATEALTALSDGAALLASTPALSAADTFISETGKEYRLREALEGLAGAYDYAVIDTPPALGILTINALAASEGAIVPAQADMFSLQGISQLGNTLGVVKRYCNPSLRILGILLTRYNRRAVISREVAELLENTAKGLGSKLFTARIRECTAVKEAQATRRSLFAYADGSNAAEDYRAFFNELKKELA